MVENETIFLSMENETLKSEKEREKNKKRNVEKGKKFTGEMHKRFCKRFHEEQKFFLSRMHTSSTSWLHVLPLLISLNLPQFYSSSFLSFYRKKLHI